MSRAESETTSPSGPNALRRLRAWIQRHRRQLIAGTVLLAQTLGALSSVDAIMQTRTSQGAVAWVISLNAMPYVAVPAYWVFGRSDFNGYVTARRTYRETLETFWQDFEGRLREHDLIYRSERETPFVSERLAKLPATRYNDAELLLDGDAVYDSILRGIAAAQDYVLVQFYIIRDDESGRQLRDALVERAQAGVRCFVLYDEIGSRLPSAYLRSLRDAGVIVHPFNTTQGTANRFQLNFRNHRKIVIVDGHATWVGGLNVGLEYTGRDPEVGYWRDTHLRCEGPIVQSVQVSFVEDWHWAARETLDDLNWTPAPAPSGKDLAMLCLPSGPVDPYETATLFFLNAINNAEDRLWIATPYFVPDEQFVSALQLAALRGVDVRILVPDTGDNPLVDLSFWSYLPKLQQVGVKFYRYTKGFMHHKVLVVDDRWSTVGTANFDNRSFRLNFEITMGIEDPAFTAQVAAMLETDMTDADPVPPGAFEQRSAWFRFWVQAARLTAPIQ